MRILVVDDEEVMQRVIGRALAAAGHQSVIAASHTEPPADRFDGAIIDVHSAPDDGIRLARRLLAERHVDRVVFFTGSTDPRLLREASKLGPVIPKASGTLQEVIAALEPG